MTKQTDAAAAERKVMDRYEARLAKAYEAAMHAYAWEEADDTLRILRASAAALYPGTQKRKHLLEALGKMVTAACRVIRKGGGQ